MCKKHKLRRSKLNLRQELLVINSVKIHSHETSFPGFLSPTSKTSIGDKKKDLNAQS